MYYITYKNHTKKIETLNQLKIRDLFNVPKDVSVFLQEYNDDMNLYVDLEWSDLDNAASPKLRLCEEELTHPLAESQKGNRIHAEEIFNCMAGPSKVDELNDSDDEITEIVTCISDIDNGQKLERLNAYTDVNRPDISHIENTKPIPVLDRESIFPTIYKLPKYNPNSKLGKALINMKYLSRTDKAEFLDKIYESFSARGIFYLKQYYPSIVNAILNEYPHLSYGLSSKAAKDLWTSALFSKSYNARKRKYHDEPALVTAKQLQAELKARPDKPAESIWGIPNYKPIENADDEDQFAVDGHRVWMVTAFKNADRQDDRGITKRMDLSFKKRRNLLFSEAGENKENAVEAILLQYPCLGLETQAMHEIRRLFGHDITAVYSMIINAFAEKIDLEVNSSKSKHKIFMDNLFRVSNVVLEKEVKKFKLIGNIAIILSEDPNGAIGTELSSNGAPKLQVSENGAVSLTVNRVPFINDISSGNAAALWVASFMFFDLSVPPKILKTYTLLQHLIFNVPKDTKFYQASTKVIAIYNHLKDKL